MLTRLVFCGFQLKSRQYFTLVPTPVAVGEQGIFLREFSKLLGYILPPKDVVAHGENDG